VSKVEALKIYILNYIHHFSTYDYIAYAWLILLFFITILLAIIVAKKSPTFSILILLIALTLLFAGPFALKHYLDKFLRPSSTQIEQIKKLTFSDTLIINGTLTNLSKKSFSTCDIYISVTKIGKSDIQNLINQLKPLRKQSISINSTIEVNDTKEFRVVFDNYKYSQDINISSKSECY
jgi:hypothetical protein